MKKRIVVLTGAGISAESGIQTFRDGDGLWENHRIEDVATPEAFAKNPELVLNFYNYRRQQVLNASPNAAHKILVELEKRYEVHIITQNIDDLHERAGSKNVMHLHGEIVLSRTTNPVKPKFYEYNKDLKMGDKGEDGFQLRPHIVWFGEDVPMIQPAANLVSTADILIIIGTSLVVYPAANLVNYVAYNTPIYVVDKKLPSLPKLKNLTAIEMPATLGLQKLMDLL
jgi:NAD-dependent deacetylase